MDGCSQLPPFVALRGVAEEPQGAEIGETSGVGATGYEILDRFS